MTLKISNILLLIALSVSLYAQDEIVKPTQEKSEWHSAAAKTIPAGRKESGLFAPLRIGLKNNTELSVHPIWFFVFPNAKLKKNWTLNSENKLQVATEHGFTMPTILLNILAKQGVGGIFPANQSAPPILTLNNQVIASYYYHKDHSISLKAGLEMNILQSLYQDFSDVELLIAYPRTASYSHFYTGQISLHFTGLIANKFGYDADVRMFLIPDKNTTWVFEWNPKLYYHFSNKVRIMLGALVTTGNIPHEKASFRALPVLDLQFSFSKKKKK